MSAPIVTVITASTSPHPAGGVVLCVHTPGGLGRLHFPAYLARHLIVTNPAGLSPGGHVTAPKATPATPRSHYRAGVTPERLAAYEAIERESAADPRVWGAVGRACRRHGIESKAFFAWRHNRRARERAAAETKPSFNTESAEGAEK